MPGESVGQRTRVLMVDDHAAYLEAMSRAINEVAEDFQVVGTTANPHEVVALVRERGPEIVLLDIRMPKREGLEIARELRAAFPDVKLVIHSVSDDPDDAYDAMHLGISGYISKISDLDELIAALRLIESGQTVLAPFVVQSVISDSRPRADLSQDELNVLKLMGEGLDNSEIGERLSMSRSTVKRNVQAILKKLGVTNRTEAAAYAARRGLV